MGEAVHDDAVRLDAPRLHVADVVDDENALVAELEAVWSLEQLGAESGRRFREQALRVPIVSAEDSRERHAGFLDGTQREGRAVIAGVDEHRHTCLLHQLHELRDRWDPVMAVRHQSDAHQAVLHSGSATSSRTRSSYVSRAVTTAKRSPSTITSAPRPRVL